ncbi:hypothetical protein BV25DRAFT_1090795 [Artomyces pyxidatus]|uniref:Uncharacterized protein n=1 Tax=Artomyces pyxidatus TaxID=48021 RepID=A0ACB8TFU6_9AGAM|nr:hypothetical protein BV25DRAFT_1090795 [Artomyces pyxidatus]
MSSGNISDYLTKRILTEKNIVTFRSLSRELGIHVNQAKTDLAEYYSSNVGGPERTHATYLISGEPHRLASRESNGVEDMEVDGEDFDGDVKETKVMLVDETDLEAKKSFLRIHSIHIYSLSPMPLNDLALVCYPTEALQDAEVQKPDLSIAVGRVSSADVELLAIVPKTKALATVAASSSISSRSPELQKFPSPRESPSINSTAKPKVKAEKTEDGPTLSGKINFGRAKPADLKRTDSKLKAIIKKEEPAEPSTSKATVEIEKKATRPEPKRGVKRKSALNMDDSEEEQSPPPAPPPAAKTSKAPSPSESKAKPLVRVKKGVVLSDDEDDGEPSQSKRFSKLKVSTSESEAETALRAMMEIDDDEVTKVSRHTTEPSQGDETDKDVEMDTAEDSQPDPLPTTKAKRKPKKEVPVGSNGLKKRRVIKSRSTVDAKGYFVTEDYSSYESVDEEEPETPLKTKVKNLKKSASVKTEAEEEPSLTKAAAKPQAKGAGTAGAKLKRGAGSKGPNALTNYFGKSTK